MSYQIMYLRKSRADRPDETVEEVLAKHEQMLQEYAAKKTGDKIPEDRIFREVVSGETIDSRPMMQRVLSIIEDPECSGVYVVDPQRLTRGDLMDCGLIVNAFRYSNTVICTPRHDYRLDLDIDRKMFQMELTNGSDYLEYNKMILDRGRIASVKQGWYIGSVAPFGYRKIKIDKKPTLEIVEEEAVFVRMIYKLFLEGAGYYTISRKLRELGAKPRSSNVFGMETIRRILRNDIYIGRIHWKQRQQVKVFKNGKIQKKNVYMDEYIDVPGKHEAIIDQEVFDAVQARIGTLPRYPGGKELSNPFAGLIKCKNCGRTMRYERTQRKRHKDRYRYNCPEHIFGNCPNLPINANQLIPDIIEVLRANLEDFEVRLSVGDDLIKLDQQVIISRLEEEARDIEKRQEQLYDLLESGVYTVEVFSERNKRLKFEREENKKALQKAKDAADNFVTTEEKAVSLRQAIDALEDDSVSALTKNMFLKEIVEVIYVKKTKKAKYNGYSDYDLEVRLK